MQHILIVDDEPFNVEVYTAVFRRMPYKIRSANSASEALEVLAGFDVDACCVAFDGATAWATRRAARALADGVHVVALRRCRALTASAGREAGEHR